MDNALKFDRRSLRLCVSAIVLTGVAAHPAHAGGTVAVTTPTAVTPSSNQLNGPTIDSTACAGQYTNYINGLSTAAVATQAAGVAAEAVGDGVELGLITFDAGDAATIVGLGTQAAGLGVSVVQATAQTAISALPSCDQTFAGTVSVTAGGANVSGDSIFNNNLGVAGNLNVGGTFAATNITTPNNVTASGTVSAGTVTDGVASLSNGNLTGVNSITATTGDITTVNSTTINNSGLLTTGSLQVNGPETVTGLLTTNGQVNHGNITTDSLTVNNNATVNGLLTTNGQVNNGLITTDSLVVNQNATISGLLTTNGISNTGTIATDRIVATDASITNLIAANPISAANLVVGGTALGITLGGGMLSGAGGLTSSIATTGNVNAIAIGNNANAVTATSTAMGANAAATAAATSAYGASARATGAKSSAIGASATATGASASALGANALATDDFTTAVGAGASAQSVGATALGQGAGANADYATAVGQGATASGAASVAVGGGATSGVAQGVAVGAGATVTSAGSVALGAGSTAGAANGGWAGLSINGQAMTNYASASSVVSVGGGAGSATPYRQITNVADGAVGPTSTDAINGSQLYKTITGLNNQIMAAQREERAGIAAAVALTTAPMPSQGGKTTWAGNTAAFRGQTAMGFSMAHRLDVNLPVAMTAGVSYGQGGQFVARVGMMGEF